LPNSALGGFLVSAVPDFNTARREWVPAMPSARFARTVMPDSAETESLLGRGSVTVTCCPALCWQTRGVDIVVCKLATDRFSARLVGSDGDATRRGPGPGLGSATAALSAAAYCGCCDCSPITSFGRDRRRPSG
jgi:hypothetical protein